MTGSNAVQLFLLEQLPEILVTKLAGSSLGAEAVGVGVGRDISTAEVHLELCR